MKPYASVNGEITKHTEVSLELVSIQDSAQHALVQIVCKFKKIIKNVEKKRELFLTFQPTLRTLRYHQRETRH